MASYRRRHDQRISQGIPILGNLHIELEIYNEAGWKKAEDVPKKAARAIQKGYDKAVTSYAKDLLRIVRKSITRGRPPKGTYWEPLSPNSIKKWSKQYPEHHLMSLTGEYLRSIGSFTRGKRSYIGVVSGQKRQGPHPDGNNLTMNQVAIIQEFGTANDRVPARPLWRSAVKEVERGRTSLKAQIIFDIRRQLINEGFL